MNRCEAMKNRIESRDWITTELPPPFLFERWAEPYRLPTTAEPAQGRRTKPAAGVDKENHRTKVALTGLFMSLVMLFGTRRQRRKRDALKLNAIDLALLGVATHRMGRLVAYDVIAEPLRAPFATTVPDGTGAGKTTVARGQGTRQAVGELLTCPICAGTWVAAILVYGLQILPRPTRILVTIMGVTGIAEILNAGVEALSWFGLVERKELGSRMRKE
jgi:hypothetical protein